MKKKVMIATIAAFLFILFGVGAIIFTIGKTANTQTNIQLERTSSDIEHALYYASFAANSHNTQSWKVNLDPKQKRLGVFLNNKRSLNVVDPNNRELYISIGCYIQSLKKSFEAYGYNVSISNIAPSKENKYQVVLINYQKIKNNKINNKQLDIIQKRHTDKRKFQKKPINRTVVSSLIKKYDNVYYYAKRSKTFKYLQKGSLAAAAKQYKSQDFLKEQGKWLRFSNQEAKKKQDGISGDMLGLNPIIKTFYYLTSNHKNATSNNFVKQSKNTLINQVENCAGFFVITGEQNISKWIAVGEKSQAFWYDCVRNNIAVQPISAMIEIPSYNQKLQQNLGKSQPVQLILRVGYVNSYGKNVGPRRNLKDYITVKK